MMAHNKSMDVSGKQLLSYSACVVTFGLRVAGLPPRHLSRWASSREPERKNYETVFILSLVFAIHRGLLG